MALDISAPESIILHPIITVFGVGGAGGNAVNNMKRANLRGVDFITANTDAQALMFSESNKKIQLGETSTRGLGAGATPSVGRAAAEESKDEIKNALEGSNMVFITAGMGGGTGTGAAPIIAQIAKEMGILTVGVVTKPFFFEGAKRMKIAEEGISELQHHVDTLIIIPNQNLFRIANENTTFEAAFAMADEVLHAGVRGITDLITAPGLVNLDFADIQTVMQEKGKAMMGTGEATGDERAIRAAEAAIANPLLDQSSMFGASAVLINITGGKDMTLYEVDSAANRIREEIGEIEANIIFGSTFNPELEGKIRVSVVATGINNGEATYNKTKASEQSNAVLSAAHQIEPITDDNNDINEALGINFNEFNSDAEGKIEDEQLNIQQQFEQLTKQIALQQSKQNTVNNHVESPIAPVRVNNIATAPKPSLFKRMWNSLKSSDPQANSHETNNAYEHYSNTQQNHDYYTQNNGNIQETPSFLRKKK